jgi:hypothetical protein
MTTYFLSYARADEAIALRFADDLMAAGCSVWVDQYDIRPSQHWDRAVETAVRSCHGLIVMLSPASSASANVADEVSVAIDGGKDVIPILISKCAIPLRMSRMQFIDATADYDRALRQCLGFIAKAAPRAADQIAAPEARTTTTLPADILQRAERRLTGFMGPIAGRLVKGAARSAESEPALYRKLSESIPDEKERATFLGWMAQPNPSSVVTPRRPAPEGPGALETSPKDLDKITHALARQLGPIAAQLVNREAKTAASREDLCHRLAERISNPTDRLAFLKDLGGA